MAECSYCRKQIKGKSVLVVPTNLDIALGKDKVRSYHPKCYAEHEKKAKRK